MKMKTSELTGAALDWAVAKCEGKCEGDFAWYYDRRNAFNYSTDWAQGGPIIEQWAISLCPDEYITGNTRWCATCTNNGEGYEAFGPTPLVAAMRCYVASKLGDEADVPQILCDLTDAEVK